MLPAFCMVQIGPGRGLSLPLPVLLLWPLIGLAWLVVFLARILVPRGSEAGKGIAAAVAVLAALGHLSGLQIEIAAAGSRTTRVRFV